MKSNDRFNQAANAGGGTTQVPFYGVIAPTAFVSEIIATALSTAIGHAYEAIRRSYWERKTRVSLSGLDDAMLKDIGVARSQIPYIARSAAESRTYDPARRFPWGG
jgi:uncharacterized protein YjiS (DUF1127 family)